jgi:hypothetical protein
MQPIAGNLEVGSTEAPKDPVARIGLIDRSARDRSKANPGEVVQTPVARLSGRASSRATTAYAFHAAEILPDIFTPRRVGIESLALGSTEERRALSNDTPRRGCKCKPDLR